MGLVILPYRVLQRDFYSRLLLAHQLSSTCNVPVIVCTDQVAEYLSHCYTEIILIDTPSTNTLWHDFVLRVSTNGGYVFIMDEDGVNNLSTSNVDFWLSRIPAKLHENINNIFCWGSYDFSYFSEFSSTLSSKVVITGNPRLDLLRYHGSFLFDSLITRLKNTFGEFSLVIDGFGLGREFDSNIFTADEVSTSHSSFYDGQSDSINLLQFQRRSYFTQHLIQQIISQRTSFFVIRPHPTSSPVYWNCIASRFPNVVVDSSLSIEPWLLAASRVITMSSTVSLQAVYLQKSLFDLKPPIHLRSLDLDGIFYLSCNSNDKLLSSHELRSQASFLSDYWQIPHSYEASIDFISEFLATNVSFYQSSFGIDSILQSLASFQNYHKPSSQSSLQSLGLSSILQYCANLQKSPYLEPIDSIHVSPCFCLLNP